MTVDDTIDPATAAKLVTGEAPMAMCTRCDVPVISTFEFAGAEFYCQLCGGRFGFLAPRAAPWRPALQVRHDELKAAYDKARLDRDPVQRMCVAIHWIDWWLGQPSRKILVER